MTHLFIINPAAGSKDRTEEYRKEIETLCKAKGIPYCIAISQAPGQCRQLANEAARSGETLHIYACGGDGTLNEVAAGAAGFPNVAITSFAGGSGNDFIKIFSETKPFHQLERLLDYKETEFDLIQCNDDLALNICSVGLDARIGTDVSNYKRIPLLHGFRAYAASTLVNVIKGIAEHYIVEIDGETVDDKFTFVCVCNGRFYGGGFNPVPEADPCDGKLDILLVKKVSRLQVPGIIGKYKNGQYKELPKLVRHFRTDRIRILCDKQTPINLDGELRWAQQVNMQVATQKVRFFYPKELTFQAKEPVTP